MLDNISMYVLERISRRFRNFEIDKIDDDNYNLEILEIWDNYDFSILVFEISRSLEIGFREDFEKCMNVLW